MALDIGPTISPINRCVVTTRDANFGIVWVIILGWGTWWGGDEVGVGVGIFSRDGQLWFRGALWDWLWGMSCRTFRFGGLFGLFLWWWWWNGMGKKGLGGVGLKCGLV